MVSLLPSFPFRDPGMQTGLVHEIDLLSSISKTLYFTDELYLFPLNSTSVESLVYEMSISFCEGYFMLAIKPSQGTFT